VEQDFSHDIFSEFVTQNSLMLTKYDGSFQMIDSTFFHNFSLQGLTLDLLNNKIYLDGRKLTSKDLPSQNTTIEVLKALLNSTNGKITNIELNTSSYSTNKNDMTGKILLPLKRLINAEKNIDFDIQCS
jgi:hypothetical protein